MIVADLARIDGRSYPARRRTQNLVGGASPIQAKDFALGYVTLEPERGQAPWHNQEQEEVYFIVRGGGVMRIDGEEVDSVSAAALEAGWPPAPNSRAAPLSNPPLFPAFPPSRFPPHGAKFLPRPPFLPARPPFPRLYPERPSRSGHDWFVRQLPHPERRPARHLPEPLRQSRGLPETALDEPSRRSML